MTLPKVSIVTVICGNNIDFMGKCLISLIENTEYPDVEYIIVSDSEAEMRRYISKIGEYNPAVKCVYREHKSSNSSNRNIGVMHASANSKYILFTDSDVLYSNKQWLNNLVCISEKNDEIGIIGGTDDPTSWGHCCFINNELGILINVLMAYQAIPNHPQELMIIPGCNMLIRRSVFEDIGGWDEGFLPAYGEDIDICLRCLLAGYRVLGMYNEGVKHLYRTTNENNSCERIGPDEYRFYLNWAAMSRLAMKYQDVLPTTSLKSHSEWLDVIMHMRSTGRSQLANLQKLPPTVINGKLNPLYLPATISCDDMTFG